MGFLIMLTGTITILAIYVMAEEGKLQPIIERRRRKREFLQMERHNEKKRRKEEKKRTQIDKIYNKTPKAWG